MSLLREASGIARKEILLDLRFALQFFLTSITSPLTRLMPLLFVYRAILRMGGVSPISGVSIENYFPFLVIGTLFYTTWVTGTSVFQDKFLREKYWQTADLMFLVPIRTGAIITGYGFSVIARLTPTLVFFLGALLIARPPSLSGFFLALLALSLTLGVGLAFGLFFGGVALSTENAVPFFQYFIGGVTLLSAFFYPAEILTVLPSLATSILLMFVRLNPLYAGVTFAREAWYGTDPLPWMNLVYLASTLAILVPFATGIFRTVWQKFGIQG